VEKSVMAIQELLISHSSRPAHDRTARQSNQGDFSMNIESGIVRLTALAALCALGLGVASPSHADSISIGYHGGYHGHHHSHYRVSIGLGSGFYGGGYEPSYYAPVYFAPDRGDYYSGRSYYGRDDYYRRRGGYRGDWGRWDGDNRGPDPWDGRRHHNRWDGDRNDWGRWDGDRNDWGRWDRDHYYRGHDHDHDWDHDRNHDWGHRWDHDRDHDHDHDGDRGSHHHHHW